MVLDLELYAQCSDHSIVEIHTIVWDTVSIDEILFDEPGYNILGNGGKRSRLNPLHEIINGHQDEVVSIRGCELDFPNHINAPHHE